MAVGFVPSRDLTDGRFSSVTRSHRRSAMFYQEISRMAGLGPWIYLRDCNDGPFNLFTRSHGQSVFSGCRVCSVMRFQRW